MSDTSDVTDTASAIRGLNYAISSFVPQVTIKSSYRKLIEQSKQIPRPSEARLRESLSDEVVTVDELLHDAVKKEKTYFYLGYGSNMCALTFLQRRKIRPLAQANVVVPSISLTFDLSGVPYSEPCFGNVRYRSDDESGRSQDQEKGNTQGEDYHKNRWHKGLVGVVYEVTASDFAHIIATEGGGAAYHDVLVDCHVLSPDPSQPVPLHPTSSPLRAHTLFSPGRASRPDFAYAQPSARYMKLLTDGGAEHDLPHEYRAFMDQIRPYTISTQAQRLGSWIWLLVWGPLYLFIYGGAGSLFIRPDGTYPPWLAELMRAIAVAAWKSYDVWFKPMFGDGERTIEDGGSGPDEGGKEWERNEKAPLLGLRNGERSEAWNEPGTRGGEEMV